MDTTVSIAAIGLAGTTVAGLIWVVKYFAKTLSKDLQEHTKAAVSQTQTNEEMLRFMRNLNGKLERTVREKLEA